MMSSEGKYNDSKPDNPFCVLSRDDVLEADSGHRYRNCEYAIYVL